MKDEIQSNSELSASNGAVTHAPTPWRVLGEDSADGIPYIEIATGEMGTLSYSSICHVQPGYDDDTDEFVITAETRERAELIVRCVNAMPAMLELLEDVGNLLTDWHYGSYGSFCPRQARELSAKIDTVIKGIKE
jgi:hypothetical protein